MKDPKIKDRVRIYGATKQLDGSVKLGPIKGYICKVVPAEWRNHPYRPGEKIFDQGYVIVHGDKLGEHGKILFYRAHPKQCRRLKRKLPPIPTPEEVAAAVAKLPPLVIAVFHSAQYTPRIPDSRPAELNDPFNYKDYRT